VKRVEPARIAFEHEALAYALAIENGSAAAETSGYRIQGRPGLPLILTPGIA
jgi:hypothetical protein